MTEEITLETSIPFSGFYNTIHDAELDSGFNNQFDNCSGDVIESLAELARPFMNWGKAFELYAKEYSEHFAEEFKLESLTFKELISPREYNFTTDRIFCNISLTEVRKMFEAVDKEKLEKAIADRFTSCSGFSSFYHNSLEANEPMGYKRHWAKDVKDWDCNQVGTLLEVYVEDLLGKELDDMEQYNLFPYAYESASQIVQECLENNEVVDRCYRLADYLRTREERRYNRKAA